MQPRLETAVDMAAQGSVDAGLAGAWQWLRARAAGGGGDDMNLKSPPSSSFL